MDTANARIDPPDIVAHDKKYHHGHWDGKSRCKYRDDRAAALAGVSSQTAQQDIIDRMRPEDVDGEEVDKADDLTTSSTPKVDRDRAREIFREYRNSLTHSDKWLMKNLGIPSSNRKKFDDAMWSFAKNKSDKHQTLDKLVALSDGIPKDAWKPGKKKGAASEKSSQVVQMLLGGGKGGWGCSSSPMTSVGGYLSKYFHAQGKKSYSSRMHKPTGLYETVREHGNALAREEDVPGMSAFNRNRPKFVEHGTVPSALTAQQIKDDFKFTANGSTYPMVGNVGGRNYIVKRGILPEGVRRNADLQDHIRKEVAADRFIRAAGLHAPVCNTFEIPHERHAGVSIDEKKLSEFYGVAKKYKDAKEELYSIEKDDNATVGQEKKAKQVKDDAKAAYKKYESSLGKESDAYRAELKSRVKNGQLKPYDPAMDRELVKIAEYVDGGVSLVRSWHQGTAAEKANIKQQVIDAYPVISFLENVDSFKNDNVLVDSDSNLWFIDNGACFDYRAQGGKKLLSTDGNRMATSKDKSAKPWFYERNDPTDFTTGYLGLLYAPDQALLQEILADVDDSELVAAGRKYDFEALAKTLPPDIGPRVMNYAKQLNATLANPPAGWLEDENGN